MLGSGVMVWLIPPLIVATIVIGPRRGWSWWRVAGVILIGCCFLLVISQLLFPFPIDPRLHASRRVQGVGTIVQWVPLRTIGGQLASHTASAQRQVVGNVLLFVPLGFLVPAVIPWLRPPRRAIPAAIIAAFAAETLQYLAVLAVGATYRTTDIDDVLLNALGILLGYAGLKLIRAVAARPTMRTNW